MQSVKAEDRNSFRRLAEKANLQDRFALASCANNAQLDVNREEL